MDWRNLGIEGPTLVRLLDLLQQKEWIQRLAAPDDKRCKYATLTGKASAQIEIIDKLTRELRSGMMNGLSTADIDAGLRVMRHILDNLHDL